MQNGFKELFDRNEYVYDLSRDKLVGIVVEITGGTSTDSRTKAIVATFYALRQLADFDADVAETDESKPRREMIPASNSSSDEDDASRPPGHDSIEMRVGYTINLNLPETTNPEVFNAIFKSLRENLLKN